jgi:DHA3 family tetracycline resistance protein-like MFS transporter
MALAIFIGSSSAAIPIRTGASGTIAISLLLILIMPESGFNPTPREDRTTWEQMWHTFKKAVSVVHTRPRLGNILWVGFFFGLYSEGFDRLWVKHLIDTFELPLIFGQTQVGFFGVLRIVALILVILATRFLEKRWDTSSPRVIGRAMLIQPVSPLD